MQHTKKILVLLESLDVNDSSGTKGRVALLQNMVAAGFEVTALHYTQRDIAIDGTKTIAVTEGLSLFYFLSRLQRYLFKWFKINIGTYYEKHFGFSFNWRSAESAFAKALKKYNPRDFDMIWTLGKGTQFRAHAGVLKCSEWHIKWYAYVHDPYPEQLYPRPYNFVPLGYKQKRLFFKQVTKQAHRIVFPSKLLKEWMQSYFVAIKGKSVVIPHQISDITEKGKSFPSYFEKSCFSIVHAGNLLDLRDPTPLVQAFQNFLLKYPKAKSHCQLLFLGNLDSFEQSMSEAIKQTPEIYASNGYVPFEQVISIQQNCCVNVILEARSEISPFLPGKFAHCILANKPIILIGPFYSESKRLLGASYPYSYDFNEIRQLQEGIESLYLQWSDNKLKHLNRLDLEHYMSARYLKEILE